MKINNKLLFLLLAALTAFPHAHGMQNQLPFHRRIDWSIEVPVAKGSSLEQTRDNLKELLGNHFHSSLIIGENLFLALSGSKKEIKKCLQKEPWFKEEDLFDEVANMIELAGQRPHDDGNPPRS